jgi:hypothetical protein
MMNQKLSLLEAEHLVARVIVKLQLQAPVPIAINSKHTEETKDGFVFFYNSREYNETRDFRAALAGNSPILITNDAKIFLLNPSVSWEIAARNHNWQEWND